MPVFYSFHYKRDVFRVQQIRQMGHLEGQPLLNAQEWESVKKRQGVTAWIEEQMRNKQAVVVLVGRETASRPWVRHEIIKAWNDQRPLVGVRIHGLKDPSKGVDAPGPNPFDEITTKDGTKLSSYVTLHSPTGDVYASIEKNLKSWVAGAYKRS